MVFNWIVNQLKTYDNKVNSVFSDNKILKEKKSSFLHCSNLY